MEMVSVFFMTYWSVLVIGSLLAAIAINFLLRFVIPAKKLERELLQAITELARVKSELNGSPVIDLGQIATQGMATEKLSHLWNEYAETLHSQKKVDELGQERVICWRATAMAEVFFTEQVLVNTPLKTEFYKHVPGILTGLGIIGTFSGLIQGLKKFEVSSNPDAVRASLGDLIQGVGHAFVVSAIAIVLAMLFTWIEKAMVTALYRQVEELCQLLDSFFDAGAGEEYLARLVQASETSATQALQLKDALVTDLKQILSDITAQQIQASTHNSQQTSQNLAQAFADTMRLPMERISGAVDRVSSNQGDAVNKMLTDVLANFSAQMQEMFGGQLHGMTDLLGQTNNAMLATVGKFDQLAVNLQNAGQGAAETMSERLREAVVAMEARQDAMTQQMSAFVEEMRSISRDSQNETAKKMQESLGQLGDQVSVMVSRLDEQAKATTDTHQDSLLQLAERMEVFLTTTQEAASQAQQQTAQASQQAGVDLGRQVQDAVASLHEMYRQAENSSTARQAELAEQSAKLLSGLVSQVESLGRRVAEAAEATKSSVVAIAGASKTAIERMNSGADSLLLGASELSDAEKRVAVTMGAIAGVAQGLQASSSNLSGASAGVQKAFDDYKTSTNLFATIVGDLKTTVETAKHEASMSTSLVAQIKSAAEQLGEAQKEAEHYLKGVTNVLGEAHTTFAKEMEKTLRHGNAQFHKELSEAVSLLSGAIRDLGDTLDLVKVQR